MLSAGSNSHPIRYACTSDEGGQKLDTTTTGGSLMKRRKNPGSPLGGIDSRTDPTKNWTPQSHLRSEVWEEGGEEGIEDITAKELKNQSRTQLTPDENIRPLRS